MNNTPQSETPRTDGHLIEVLDNTTFKVKTTDKVYADFARALERELNEAKKELSKACCGHQVIGDSLAEQVATLDAVVFKQDKQISELAKQNHRLSEALVIAKDFESENENGFFSFKDTLAYEQAMSPNLSSLIVLSRAEIESWQCKCFDRSGNNSNDVGIIKCTKHTLLERFAK